MGAKIRNRNAGKSVEQARLDLLERTLGYCITEYQLANDTFAGLDSKAQASFGVSGLFVAGTVALLNAITGSTSVPVWILVSVLLCYALLVGAIVASLVALKVRDVAVPMDSTSVVVMTKDLLALPDAELTLERRANWYLDQLNDWVRVTTGVEEVNARKAWWVTSAQVMLIGAVLCAGVATVGFGFS